MAGSVFMGPPAVSGLKVGYYPNSGFGAARRGIGIFDFPARGLSDGRGTMAEGRDESASSVAADVDSGKQLSAVRGGFATVGLSTAACEFVGLGSMEETDLRKNSPLHQGRSSHKPHINQYIKPALFNPNEALIASSSASAEFLPGGRLTSSVSPSRVAATPTAHFVCGTERSPEPV
ncbi:hypothetical protein Salat_2657200 [Sesamum alatum]|uniref:Uncharacterized protein n=1 Tax=Sesamum alatum TaxID=300844 RepID=A0AAE1XQ79_9LAMI|nr:hypothetical protein Salat_2657200 [Sesamum alatum]